MKKMMPSGLRRRVSLISALALMLLYLTGDPVYLQGPSRVINPDEIGVSRRLAPFDASRRRPARPNEIGITRPVGDSSARLGRVLTGEDGRSVRRLSIQSPGALELRVRLKDFDLPAGDEVYIYGLDRGGPVAGPYSGRGLLPSGEGFWSDTIPGDTIIIEHRFSGAEAPFSVAEIAHHYRPFLAEAALDCHLDANCAPEDTGNAVARLTYIQNGLSLFCSATLLDNLTHDRAPFLLTARHCIGTAGAAASVQARWLYRSTFCNSGVPNQGFTSGTGARILASDPSSDQTLLRILSFIPAGVSHADWDATPVGAGTAVYSLHHPMGSFLRRSTGTVNGTSASCPPTGLIDGYSVAWSAGATESGSDGAGLFDTGTKRLVGVLSCFDVNNVGNPVCGGGARAGKFSNFYPLIADYLLHGDLGINPIAHVVGSTNTGTISASNSYSRSLGVGFRAQMLTFDAEPGDAVQIDVASQGFAVYLALYNPSHELIAFDDSINDPLSARLSEILTAGGRYTIEVSTVDPDQSGSFTLSSQRVQIFADVPLTNEFYRAINLIFRNGITTGCGSGNYCPDAPVTREQMAAFLLRARHVFNPPQPAMQRFADVPPSNPFYAFIDLLAAMGITTGCGGGNYCPQDPVTREQMAAFIIRALGEFNPPTPTMQRFFDVPPSNFFYAFIDRLAFYRITQGCGGGNYCPQALVTREQMAAFLARAFIL